MSEELITAIKTDVHIICAVIETLSIPGKGWNKNVIDIDNMKKLEGYMTQFILNDPYFSQQGILTEFVDKLKSKQTFKALNHKTVLTEDGHELNASGTLVRLITNTNQLQKSILQHSD